MKNRVIFFCLWIVISASIGILAYRQGRKDVWIAEFKIYQANLVNLDRERYSSDLVEFLKGRYYFLGNKIPVSWLPQRAPDYGQVGTNVSHLGIGKGPTSGEEEYRKFKERTQR